MTKCPFNGLMVLVDYGSDDCENFKLCEQRIKDGTHYIRNHSLKNLVSAWSREELEWLRDAINEKIERETKSGEGEE